MKQRRPEVAWAHTYQKTTKPKRRKSSNETRHSYKLKFVLTNASSYEREHLTKKSSNLI